jgi:AcrR family transcriptional regulator
MGLMQRHRPQVLDRQAARYRGSPGDPQREAEEVVARGRHGTAVRQAGSTDVTVIEGHIAVHSVADPIHHQLKTVRIFRAAAHAGGRVGRQALRLVVGLGQSQVSRCEYFRCATVGTVAANIRDYNLSTLQAEGERVSVTNQPERIPDEDDHDIDPRRIRSRNRLLDAAATLLTTGGVEAVTIDAVTKASKVARTTLYRHFRSSSHLLAATFERLLPQVTAPAPTSGTLREQLTELLTRQATLLSDAPLHVTTLAWLALGPTGATGDADDRHSSGALRTRVIDQYRQPFDALLQREKVRAELDDFDLELALCQLVGPLAFARMTGFRAMTHDDCERIVDDFLRAHRGHRSDTLAGTKPTTNA